MMSGERKGPVIPDWLRVAVFLLLVAGAVGGGWAGWAAEGWAKTAGQAAFGLSLVLGPMAFWTAFHGSGYSPGYRSRNRGKAFDGTDTRHFDANHDEGFALDQARQVDSTFGRI